MNESLILAEIKAEEKEKLFRKVDIYSINYCIDQIFTTFLTDHLVW